MSAALMRLKSLDPAAISAADVPNASSRAKPFSPWATTVYAVLAVAAVLFFMRGYWKGDRLATLYYPVHTAVRVATAGMLIHDGVTDLPPPLRTVAVLLGCDTVEMVEDSKEVLHDVLNFVSTNDPKGAAQLRGQLVVLHGEMGEEAEALRLLPRLEGEEAADFRLAAGAVYGGKSLSDVPSLIGKKPFEYLDSSWAAWSFQSRWHSFAGEAFDAGWVDQWIRARARSKTIIVLMVAAVCLLLMVSSLALLFWMVQPEARRAFQVMPLHTLRLGEGVGILVRAHLLGLLLLFVCSLQPLMRIHSMGYALAMLAPLLFLLAHRHWRHGSLGNLLGWPAHSRARLGLLAAALCILGLDWLSLGGIGSLAEEFGIKGHWTEGLDERLLYEEWPVRLVPLANGIIWAPFYEEVAFRGVLFPALRDRFGVFLAALFSAIVFSSLHFYSVPGFVSITLFGFINALVCHYTRSLIPSIAAHMATNFIILGTHTALFV